MRLLTFIKKLLAKSTVSPEERWLSQSVDLVDLGVANDYSNTGRYHTLVAESSKRNKHITDKGDIKC